MEQQYFTEVFSSSPSWGSQAFRGAGAALAGPVGHTRYYAPRADFTGQTRYYAPRGTIAGPLGQAGDTAVPGTTGEMALYAGATTLGSAVGGALFGALIGDKGRRGKTALRGAGVGAVLGPIGGLAVNGIAYSTQTDPLQKELALTMAKINGISLVFGAVVLGGTVWGGAWKRR